MCFVFTVYSSERSEQASSFIFFGRFQFLVLLRFIQYITIVTQGQRIQITRQRNIVTFMSGCPKTGGKNIPQGEKVMTEVGFEPTPEDQCLKLAPQTTRPSSQFDDGIAKHGNTYSGNMLFYHQYELYLHPEDIFKKFRVSFSGVNNWIMSERVS